MRGNKGTSARRRSLGYGALLRFEEGVKGALFDCRMCGQCILNKTGLTCPMRCPKNMRNGPCGGSYHGKCEVYPEMDCVWCVAERRAHRIGRYHPMERIQPPLDWSLEGTSSWLNVLGAGQRRPSVPAGEGLGEDELTAVHYLADLASE